MLSYIHVCFKDLANVYGQTYVRDFVNILSCVFFFSGLQFSALWSHRLLLNLLQILPIEIDGIMAGYVSHSGVSFTYISLLASPYGIQTCVFLSQLLLSMA